MVAPVYNEADVIESVVRNWFDILDILHDQVGSVNNVVYMIEADISQKDEAVKLLEKYGIDI